MRQFDELNIINRNILSIDDFFDDVEGIAESDREKRKKFAFDLEDLILYFFMLYLTMKEYNLINADYMKNQLQSKYLEIAQKHGIAIDTDVEGYIKQFSENIVDVTIRNADTPYFLSDDRATLIACNEAQSIIGHSELQRAIKNGYTKKRWITEKDNKVRKTHREVDNVVLPIMTPFVVGDSLMMYAHDGITFNADVEELANCRCSVVYEK